MEPRNQPRCSAFDGTRCLASGDLAMVAVAARAAFHAGGSVLVFDDDTGDTIEVEYRGTTEEVPPRTDDASAPEPADAARGRGRPKLGVVAREVTLLPRHWEWLGEQPGGASVALRKLVDDARRTCAERDRVRRAREAAYCFMSTVAGNLAGFEEANRALFAGDAAKFEEATGPWPVDVRDHARRMAESTFGKG